MDFTDEEQFIPHDIIYSSCMPHEWQTLRLPSNIKNFTPPFQACENDGVAYIIGDMKGIITTLDLETFCVRRFPSNPPRVAIAAGDNGHCFVHGKYLVVVNNNRLFVAMLPPAEEVRRGGGSESEFVFEFDEVTVSPAGTIVGLVSAAHWGRHLVCFGGNDTNQTWLMDMENLPAHLAALEEKKRLADDPQDTAGSSSLVPQKRTWVRPIEWNMVRVVNKAPPVRSEHCSAVCGDYLLVVGGKMRGDVCGDAWCLDLEKKAWNQITFQNGASLPKILFNSCTHSVVAFTETTGVLVMNCFGMRLSKQTCPFLAKIQLPLIKEKDSDKWRPQSYSATLTLVGQTTSNNLLCVPSHSFYREGVSYFIGLCTGVASWNPICCVRPNAITEWRPEFHHLYTKSYRKNAKAFLACCLKNGITVPHDLCGEVFAHWANELHPEMKRAMARNA